MRVSLIIPAYNEEKYIASCLDSVLLYAAGNIDEIIVVDNASTDKTAEIASTRSGVRVVYEPKKGLPSARERGRLEATGELVAYIDADCHIHKDWLPMALEIFSNHPDVVSLSGPGRYWDATLREKVLLGMSWRITPPLLYHIVGYMIFGAHFIVRKEALEKIGGFNQSITFYGEDTDLARRLSHYGTVLFRMNFYILTSARRFSEEGILRSCFVYSLNFLWPVIFHRPFTLKHKDVRK